ncbi:brevican core protein-like [Ptychodera flava]|uniref:brevican core protein-like n=1 Tax=Ptychodera flava TaxID=63121 RepID=UPI00396A66E5
MGCLIAGALLGTLLFLFLHEIIFAACPPNYVTGSDETSCYRFVAAARSWSWGKVVCDVEGAHLIDVISDEENGFLFDYATTLGLTDVWIGLNDLETEGSWNYDFEISEPLFWHWNSDQPDGGALENCAIMRIPDLGKWHDRPCSQYNAVICEAPSQGNHGPNSLQSSKAERWGHFVRARVDSGPPAATPMLTLGLARSVIDCARKCFGFTNDCAAYTFEREVLGIGLHRCKLYTSVFETYLMVDHHGIDMYEVTA